MCKYDPSLSKPNSPCQIHYTILLDGHMFENRQKVVGKVMAHSDGTDHTQGRWWERKGGKGALISFFAFASYCLAFTERCIHVLFL